MTSTADAFAVKPSARWKSRRFLWLILACVLVLPIAARAALYAATAHPHSFREANWSSTGMLPDAAAYPEARVIVFAARNGSWRSIFAVHTWIVIKPQHGTYTRYDVTGFGMPVRTNGFAPDAYWFSYRPEMVADFSGPQAVAAIPKIQAAVADYAYAKGGDYRLWPGPNSNTFVATVLRAVPDLQVTLPPTAIGKDLRVDDSLFGYTASRTGFEFELFGLLGLKVGWIEGIEINVLTLVAGIDIHRPALKLPGFGRVGIDTLAAALAGGG